ncbi:MAG: hypothetical protein Q4F99_00450 [bacterium]|nr:hypothetical protein [bacterium]
METFNTLHQLCSLHSTPGDEEEVFQFLEKTWQEQNLDIIHLGKYAIIAQPGERRKTDTILLVAHADSPGFTVSSIQSATELEVLVLGGIHPEETDLQLKLPNGERILAHLHAPDENWTRSMPLKVTLSKSCTTVQKGDRLCWAPRWEKDEIGNIHSPFLDNRIACALIADWYRFYSHLLPSYNVVLAATAMEEINGFGANVLARHVQADLAIALDVTYENEKQEVRMGQGPVITLSDASVILSPLERDKLLASHIPLQTEVYNTSGTDARAFPVLGNTLPVIALLLATRGNHSPLESISTNDLIHWPTAIATLAECLLKR